MKGTRPQNLLNSMTGFSVLEGDLGTRRIRVEVKSLNHRYLDVKTRLPREYALAELPMKSEVQSRFSRGSIEIRVERLEDLTPLSAEFGTNLSVAAQYYENLVKLQKTLGLSDEVRTSDILQFPDVIERRKPEVDVAQDPEQIWQLIAPVVEKALERLAESRTKEGKTIRASLLPILDELATKVELIEKRRETCQDTLQEKTRSKIDTVFDHYKIDEASMKSVLESRVAQEIALILDRTDVLEELSRFKGHLDHFRRTLDAKGALGRRLEFILQEMNREVNTLGNKAQDLDISSEVVRTKVLIEQLREQVLNLE